VAGRTAGPRFGNSGNYALSNGIGP